MKRSQSRILTTHTGSLPRPQDLAQLMLERERGRPVDLVLLEERIRAATAEVVGRQLDTGIDVVNDGEASKPDYSNYVKDRLTGFDAEGSGLERRRQDEIDFPGFVPRGTETSVKFLRCTGPVGLKDGAAVRRDIARLQAALAGRRPEEVFMTAVSPGQIARFMANAYYASEEAYVYALAEAMRDEYRAIVEAGFVLQVDCPDLASGRTYGAYAQLSLEEWRTVASMHVAALNHALSGLPADRVRLHLCWGNYEGPHHHDVPLRDIIDIALGAHVGGISLEAANPRHAHEWKVFREVRLTDDKVLIPGVIESCTNYIEHPELVAERLVRWAGVVGRERVLAGTDCGFSTFVGASPVHPGIAWAKLASMVEGARLASQELW
jgi:5-methyltetrahydropteroyltriglutamate--homocysteine methyltransferase